MRNTTNEVPQLLTVIKCATASMALAGLCISRSSIDIVLISVQDGTLQSSSTTPLQQIDPIEPNADIIIAPFKQSLLQVNITVLTILRK